MQTTRLMLAAIQKFAGHSGFRFSLYCLSWLSVFRVGVVPRVCACVFACTSVRRRAPSAQHGLCFPSRPKTCLVSDRRSQTIHQLPASCNSSGLTPPHESPATPACRWLAVFSLSLARQEKLRFKFAAIEPSDSQLVSASGHGSQLPEPFDGPVNRYPLCPCVAAVFSHFQCAVHRFAFHGSVFVSRRRCDSRACIVSTF